MFYYFFQYLNNVQTTVMWKSSISVDSVFLGGVQSKKIMKKKFQVFNDFFANYYWIFF